MDHKTDFPWSWEEEVEWKADLEERDYDFLQELIDNAIEPGTTLTLSVPTSSPEKTSEDAVEEYVVTA